jgi:F0F1-type ATP synthase assembly protein I
MDLSPERRGNRVAARDKRAIYRSADDGWQQAIELTVAPVLFVLLGVWLDAKLGTRPLWTISLVLFAGAASVATAYVRFQARAAKQDAGKPWTRRASKDSASKNRALQQSAAADENRDVA